MLGSAAEFVSYWLAVCKRPGRAQPASTRISHYAGSPEGQRFLIVKEPVKTGEIASDIVLVENSFEAPTFVMAPLRVVDALQASPGSAGCGFGAHPRSLLPLLSRRGVTGVTRGIDTASDLLMAPRPRRGRLLGRARTTLVRSRWTA